MWRGSRYASKLACAMLPVMTVPTSSGDGAGAAEHFARRLDAEIDRRDLRERAIVIDERRAHAVEQPDVAASAIAESGLCSCVTFSSIAMTRGGWRVGIKLVHQRGAVASAPRAG